MLPKWSLDKDAKFFFRHTLKDVGKIRHNFVPMSSESLLKQQIDRIFFSVIFIFFLNGGFTWRVREIFIKVDNLETKVSKLRPHWGHALKKDQDDPPLISLIYNVFSMK
jgi:hypothetical protein